MISNQLRAWLVLRDKIRIVRVKGKKIQRRVLQMPTEMKYYALNITRHLQDGRYMMQVFKVTLEEG